ncbi:hypothetical protein GCM10017779_30000 [Streptomyces capillispiralis]|nr:hypothetical protein GCM10017779_30000 [Streptomyces capillispiralis]
MTNWAAVLGKLIFGRTYREGAGQRRPLIVSGRLGADHADSAVAGRGRATGAPGRATVGGRQSSFRL